MLTKRFPLFFDPANDTGSAVGSPPAASEGDPGAAVTPPASGPSSEGGTGTTLDAVQIAAERDRIEAERRQLQGERDRLRAENDRLKSEKAVEPAEGKEKPITASDLQLLLRREREMAAAVPALKEKFTMADPAIFASVDTFDTVEAFRAAVEASHSSFQSRMESQGLVPKTELDALRDRYAAKYGPLGDESPPSNEGGSPGGLPTLEQLHAMSFRELDAFIAKHGDEVYEGILRSAQEA